MLYFKFVVIYFILFSFVFLISKYFNWVDEQIKEKFTAFQYIIQWFSIMLFYAVIIKC